MNKKDNDTIKIDIKVCEKLIIEFFHKSCIEKVFSWEYSIVPIWKKQEEWEYLLGEKKYF